jgi:putative ABC transport system permease protein
VVIFLAIKHLWIHRGLAACLLGGLVLAVALAVAIPVYSQAVNFHLLRSSLEASAAETRLPPYTFIFRYIGSWHAPIDIQNYRLVDDYLSERAIGLIGLPLNEDSGGLTRYVSTENLHLYPHGQPNIRNQRLDVVQLAFVSGILEHIRIVDGSLPAFTPTNEPVDVLASLKMANELGLQIDQDYLLYYQNGDSHPPTQIPVRISGIWLPEEPVSDFWFYPPESFEKHLLILEESFWGNIGQLLPFPVNDAIWRLAFDGSHVFGEHIPGLLARTGRVQIQATALLPNIMLDTSPTQAFRQFQQQASALTGMLFLFSTPVLALILYYLNLVGNMLITSQRNELAILRGRGATRRWVAWFYWMEWSLIAAGALAIGPWLGLWLSYLAGRTQSFLDFHHYASLTVRLAWSHLFFGAGVALLAIIFSVWSAWRASSDTIVSYKREQARSMQKPIWQRTYLDVLLLMVALYGLYSLRQAGNLDTAWVFGSFGGNLDPFANPLLFLLPTLFILSATLIITRLIPGLVSVFVWFFTRSRWTVPVMAFRQLARTPGTYQSAFILMVLTLSLAGFVASMAKSLDRTLIEGIYYEIGADLNLVESAEYRSEATLPHTTESLSGMIQISGQVSEEQAVWNFLPVSEHLHLPGVQAAARFGRYEADLQAGGRRVTGRIIGIDRTDFPRAAFFRDYFAPESLGALMNRLALDSASLLVDRDTWERLNLNPGDQVQVRVSFLDEVRTIPFLMTGILDYFPSLYPEEGPFYIGNLDYIFEAFGGLLPYDVWLRTNPDADTGEILLGLNQMGVTVLRAQDANHAIQQAFAAPQRQGVLGLLSSGFVSAMALTVTGFLLFSLISFQKRKIQLGVLRAIGLSYKQISSTLVLEQAMIVIVGIIIGTGISVLTSHLFIPVLPAGVATRVAVLPIVVEIAWMDIFRVYALFLGMLVVGLTVTIISMRKMKIFQAIKLGETV